jgi:hypothetical protein
VRVLKTVALISAIVLSSYTRHAKAEGNVSDYLVDGWDIKAITQVSSVGYTQVIMQKANKAVICTVYYSPKEGWTAVGGCTPVP